MKVELSSGSVVIHQYRYFYSLANELAYLALKAKQEHDAYCYTVGAVIMSYTTIETYFSHLLFSDKYPLHAIHKEMSKKILSKFGRMSLPEKINFMLGSYQNAKLEFLKSNQEPFYSFDLLRQMRNLLVHYAPETELVWSVTGEHIDNVSKLEKRLIGKFSFLSADQIKPGDFTKVSLFRIFNRDCAKWSFEQVDPFISALSQAFQVSKTLLEKRWDLYEVA